MELRGCYVLADDGLGQYADMACVSAASLKRVHPHLEIVLLCDTPTADAIRRRAHPLGTIVDTIISASAPGPSVAERSRWLKTSLRRLVRGDLLYLDVDTVVVGPIDLHVDARTHLLAAPDACDAWGRPVQATEPWVDRLFSRLGWTMPALYRNAGVIVVRDSAAGRELGDRWYAEWSRSLAAGSHRDQPALNAAIGTMPGTVGLLPLRYNAMPTYRPWLARGARVYHFWSEQTLNLEFPSSLLDHLTRHYRLTGAVDWATLDWCRRHNYPWLTRHGVRVALRAGAWRVAWRELVGAPTRRQPH